MSKSHTIGGLLGVLTLCCLPAVAQAKLDLFGAELMKDGSYAAMEKTLVSLGARANAGDTIGVMAVALDKNGQPDYSTAVVLLIESNSPTGTISGTFKVPAGLAGMSFQLVGAALTVDGGLSLHTLTLTIVPHHDA